MHIKAGSSVLACLLLVCVFVIRPSLQFSLVHKRQAEDWSGNIHTNTVSKGHAEGAGRREQPTSVHGKLASGDSADSTDALSHQGLADDTAGFPTPESSPLPASRLALRAQKTNIDNFPTSQRRRDEQTETRGAGKHRRTQRKEFQSDKSDLSRPNLLASGRRQVSARRKTPNTNSKHRSSSDSLGPDAQFIPEVVEVVEVVVDANSRIQPVDSRTSVSGGGGSVLPVYETSKNVALGSEAKRVALGPAAAVRSEALQQEVRQSDLDTHVPNMVLTAVGSVTALFGVCVMAAIFQCCCRKKRRNRLSGQDLLKNQKDEGAVSKRSRSKSPSPQKVPEIKEDKVERRQVEQDKLVEEEDDLGDFSLVQRETEILRSYRKPPPPKNRARASRVPRALKTVDPKENPNALKELVEQEEKELKQATKKANGVTSPDNQQPSTGMHPSMLDDIDSTIAALHEKPDGGKKELSKSPSKGSSDRSREPSEEKVLGTETETSSSQSQPQLPKPNGKDQLSSALSREELAKSLAKELSKATSKEGLEKPLSKSVPPKPQRTDSPKSHSAGASPKLKGKGKDALVTKSQDNVSDAESRRGNEGTPMSLEGENTGRREVQNVFALIDPTVGGGSSVERDKSKIPVRASSSPTQPTAPLRPASGKDYKRFPVPSVHGDQMDQLMKSLKTRLKEDTSSAKRLSNKVSPEDDTTDDNLEPQSRDRAHSDPTQQQEEKKEQKYHQTHL